MVYMYMQSTPVASRHPTITDALQCEQFIYPRPTKTIVLQQLLLLRILAITRRMYAVRKYSNFVPTDTLY